MPVSWSDAKTRRGAGRGGGGGPNVGEAALTEGEGLEHGEAEERVGERAMAPLGRADKEDLAVAGGEVPEEVDAPTAKQPRSSIASHEASPLADPVSHKARKAGNILNSFDSTQVPMSGSAMNSGRGHTMYTPYAQNLMLGRAQDEFSAKRTGRGREICSESEEDASRRRGCVVHS